MYNARLSRGGWRRRSVDGVDRGRTAGRGLGQQPDHSGFKVKRRTETTNVDSRSLVTLTAKRKQRREAVEVVRSG